MDTNAGAEKVLLKQELGKEGLKRDLQKLTSEVEVARVDRTLMVPMMRGGSCKRGERFREPELWIYTRLSCRRLSK